MNFGTDSGMDLGMTHGMKKRLPCAVCGLDTLRHTSWFLVVENRWLDRLKILSWHPALAMQPLMKSVCCRQHLKSLIAHWLTQASLRFPPVQEAPLPLRHDPTRSEIEFGPTSVGRLVGELCVHRESLSRVWSGSPAALECILDALITIGTEDRPQTMEFHIFEPSRSAIGISVQ